MNCDQSVAYVCVIQEGYIVSTKSSAEPLRRDKLTDTLMFHIGHLVQYPDLAACGHNPPLVVPGLCARCPLHSSRDSSYELGIFPHRFPCHASDDQGKAISRPLAADTWQEQQQTCSSGRSSIHLFSQNIIGSHLFFSCIGLLHHSSHLLHFSILWNGVPNQDCGTHTQQRARCYQHSQASAEGDLAICLEGTTCCEKFVLCFSSLFAEFTDQIIPVAMNNRNSIFHGTTGTGYKCMDPFFFFMNPRPVHEISFLTPLPRGLTCAAGKLPNDFANYTHRNLAATLGFHSQNLEQRWHDKD